MQIIVNGDAFDIEEGLSIHDLLQRIGTTDEQVAVEHNGEVVERTAFETLALKAADKLEIVHFVGGG
ncbi:MAG TPA: sulfur carrier protein ThiS [Polyangiaceae bacterium]